MARQAAFKYEVLVDLAHVIQAAVKISWTTSCTTSILYRHQWCK